MQVRHITLSRIVLCTLPLLAVGCARPQPDARAASAAEAPATGAPAAATEAGPQAPARAAADAPVVHIYKTPTCGCCGDWVTHIEEAGFKTEVQDLPDLSSVKQRLGVPRHLNSCHTALVGGYAVEGHVPAAVILRLLQEQPEVAGIAVPGMPMGSPGMEGPYTEPYDVVAFQRDGGQYVFQSIR